MFVSEVPRIPLLCLGVLLDVRLFAPEQEASGVFWFCSIETVNCYFLMLSVWLSELAVLISVTVSSLLWT